MPTEKQGSPLWAMYQAAGQGAAEHEQSQLHRTPAIGVNSLVLRQTAESRFSHFGGSWDELVTLVEKFLPMASGGYRDGVLLVPVPAEGFFSGVVQATSETPFRTTFESRRPEEAAYLQTVALGGEKLPARAVDVVVYRRDILLEEGADAVSTEARWEIVSINARPTVYAEPLTPMAMARNFLELPGGTKAEYTPQQFAEAIIYWSQRAMRG